MTSYKTVIAESPVTSSKAQAARVKKDHTLKVSCLYPPTTTTISLIAVILQATEMGPVARARSTSAYEEYRSQARSGCDESDAFLRRQCNHITLINQKLHPMWDCGHWAEFFYVRQKVHVAPRNTLPDGYTPFEGYP